MQSPFTLKSFLVLAVFGLGLGCASANEGAKSSKQSFEDGQKSSWTTPAGTAHLSHGQQGRDLFDAEPGFERGERDLGLGLGGGHGHGHGYGHDMAVTPVPEPGSEAMLLVGLLVLAGVVRRKSAARRL